MTNTLFSYTNIYALVTHFHFSHMKNLNHVASSALEAFDYYSLEFNVISHTWTGHNFQEMQVVVAVGRFAGLKNFNCNAT